ncbi:MAG: propanediol utilization protein [Paracoccaceae bacterium]
MRADGQTRIALPCHFGEWVQGRLGPEGPVALITLLPRGAGMTARMRPAAAVGCRFAGGRGAIPLPRLRRFLADLGLPHRGRFLLSPRFVPGSGTGMSTAALLAVAALAGFRGPVEVLVRACLAAEGASDPLMHAAPDCLLWASRLGRVLRPMPPPPRAQLLAGFWGPPLPTRATDSAYADISDLAEEWARAPGLAACAALASESARRCQARRGPDDDPTPALARKLGALGWARSHSGSARALIYAPGTVPPVAMQALRAAGLRGLQLLDTGSRQGE